MSNRSEALKNIMNDIIKPFAKDFCAFVAINGFIAMLTLWAIVHQTPAAN